jgi:hypothetical protein
MHRKYAACLCWDSENLWNLVMEPQVGGVGARLPSERKQTVPAGIVVGDAQPEHVAAAIADAIHRATGRRPARSTNPN